VPRSIQGPVLLIGVIFGLARAALVLKLSPLRIPRPVSVVTNALITTRTSSAYLAMNQSRFACARASHSPHRLCFLVAAQEGMRRGEERRG
jgi:hypothetical protein